MERDKVRYAVVGLGWISQDAMLPAFRNVTNSELVAIVSGDPEKLQKVGDLHGIQHRYGYEGYDELLRSGLIDAVYIALPNSMHADYSIRAARAGVHVLCEKPMAVTEQECLDMIRAAKEGFVKLMIAYRLHFEPCNLGAIEIAQGGQLGDLRFLISVFTQDVKAGDIRLQQQVGGGVLHDIGIYCINAARYLFRSEPEWVWCVASNSGDVRFAEVDETMTAVLRFPGERIAQFTVSFGTAPTSAYRMVGTKGDLRVEPAYNHQGELKQWLTIGSDAPQLTTFANSDQFGPELEHFSECVLTGADPKPGAMEGLTDVRIIRALQQSAWTGKAVHVGQVHPEQRPSPEQVIAKPPVAKPDLVKAASPHRK